MARRRPAALAAKPLVEGRCYLRFWTAYPYAIKSPHFEAPPEALTEGGATLLPYSWAKRFDSPTKTDAHEFVFAGCKEARCPVVRFDGLYPSEDEIHSLPVYGVLVK